METFKEIGKVVGTIALVIVFLCGTGWLIMGNDFFLYKYFAPRQEAVRRQVFEQTKSFQAGIVQEIRASKSNFDQTDDEGKKQAAFVYARHQADQLADQSVIPADLFQWLYPGVRQPLPLK